MFVVCFYLAKAVFSTRVREFPYTFLSINLQITFLRNCFDQIKTNNKIDIKIQNT